MNEILRVVTALVARQFVTGEITDEQASNHVCDYAAMLNALDELSGAHSYFDSEVKRLGGPFKRQSSGEWGATVVRVCKHSVRVRLNVEPPDRTFSILRPHVHAERTLRAGDQLAVRIRQLPRTKKSLRRKVRS